MGATSSRLEKALAEYPGNFLGPEVQHSHLYSFTPQQAHSLDLLCKSYTSQLHRLYQRSIHPIARTW